MADTAVFIVSGTHNLLPHVMSHCLSFFRALCCQPLKQYYESLGLLILYSTPPFFPPGLQFYRLSYSARSAAEVPLPDCCVAVLSVLCEQRGKKAGLGESSKSLGHWTFTSFSPHPPLGEIKIAFLVPSCNGLGGGPDIGNDNLLLPISVQLISLYVSSVIQYSVFFFWSGLIF